MTQEKGVSLLEVLLAITISSIVLVSFFSFFIQSSNYSDKNNDKLQAINISRKALEEFLQNSSSGRFSASCPGSDSDLSDLQGKFDQCHEYTSTLDGNSIIKKVYIVELTPSQVESHQLNLKPILSRVMYDQNKHVDTYNYEKVGG